MNDNNRFHIQSQINILSLQMRPMYHRYRLPHKRRRRHTNVFRSHTNTHPVSEYREITISVKFSSFSLVAMKKENFCVKKPLRSTAAFESLPYPCVCVCVGTHTHKHIEMHVSRWSHPCIIGNEYLTAKSQTASLNYKYWILGRRCSCVMCELQCTRATPWPR